MPVYVSDPHVEERLKAEREASGADCYDEVWEGVCFIPPLRGNEHQAMAARLGFVFQPIIDFPKGGSIYIGVNVSDREEDWKFNYRIPDVAVVLTGGKARDCDTHLCGGPDFLVEILSPQDRAREKLDFYSEIGVREVLLVDRDPWGLELYQNKGKQLMLVGKSILEEPQILVSSVLPVSLRLIAGPARSLIEVTHRDGKQRWVV